MPNLKQNDCLSLLGDKLRQVAQLSLILFAHTKINVLIVGGQAYPLEMFPG
jgi:hypothetical protein